MKTAYTKTYQKPAALVALVAQFPMIDPAAMSFPENWQDEPLWK